MKAKRKRPDPRGKGKSKKSGSAPHELIVQRLASEPDNKQTLRPVQPREFVAFPYEDLTLANLKKALANHYSLPASLCDVLVTNKGPSCTSMEQIPHRKDKVRFKFLKSLNERSEQTLLGLSFEKCQTTGASSAPVRKAAAPKPKADYGRFSVTTQFPPSVSIASLLDAGKLIKPVTKNKCLLTFEQFDIASKEWTDAMEVECIVDSEKFSSGGFRDAYHCKLTGKSAGQNISNRWVIKTYNEKSKEVISTQLKTNIESHCRKQVQMHEVARHLTKKFQSQAPQEMG
ncbi:unnamed protein product [Pocillopora meandrina]|uniref:Alpha-type protein kinase domain-containing protein n=1 Tax=Pocillopora meandrina TaxID=46732 RepID=A0AAU9W2L6_9CNID|nr:unnamed protein product [Pocillopora meandrina]